ncbi:MAG: hypothetical protein ACOYB4_07680 [Methyloceanibacter sp.]
MGSCRLGLAVFAAACLILAAKPSPGHAQAALTLSLTQVSPTVLPLEKVGGAHHRKRSYAFYCYPRNHWWFYRPYTTAKAGYARCMPYFHYLGPGQGRGAKGGRYPK